MTTTFDPPRTRRPADAYGRALARDAAARREGERDRGRAEPPSEPPRRPSPPRRPRPDADERGRRRVDRAPAQGRADRRAERTPIVADDAGAPAVAAAGIATLVAVLIVIGLVMVLSASSVLAIQNHLSPWYYVERQSLWAAIGGVAMAVGWRIDHRRWQRFGRLFVILVGIGLVAVLVPGIGKRVGGSSRWLGAGFVTFQPSEFAKLALAIFAADLLARRADRIDDWRQALVPILAVGGVLVGLILAQPDMGTASIVVVIGLVTWAVAGPPRSQLVRALCWLVGGALVLAWAEPYRRARLLSFRHPFADPGGTGYQLAQSLVGLGSGGATGVGLGQSRAKWGFLPNAHTDFIFSIIGEEAGLIGSILVVLLFLALAVLGVRTARRSPDRFGSLLAAAITSWIVFQAFVNIGAVIGMLPVTGVPLPFVSFGGSSLVITMGAMGILASIARAGDERRRRPRTSRPDGGLRGRARSGPRGPARDSA